jgi:hypothetical protein
VKSYYKKGRQKNFFGREFVEIGLHPKKVVKFWPPPFQISKYATDYNPQNFNQLVIVEIMNFALSLIALYQTFSYPKGSVVIELCRPFIRHRYPCFEA